MFKFVRKISRKDSGAFFLKLMGLSFTLDCQERNGGTNEDYKYLPMKW